MTGFYVLEKKIPPLSFLNLPKFGKKENPKSFFFKNFLNTLGSPPPHSPFKKGKPQTRPKKTGFFLIHKCPKNFLLKKETIF